MATRKRRTIEAAQPELTPDTSSGAATAVATDRPAGTCSEFSVSFALLTTDNKRTISFGVTRGCVDASTPFYVISFVLRDKIGDDFQDRVRLLVTIGPECNDKAQAIIDRGLRSTQKNFLEGPITSKARSAPPGTTEETELGAEMSVELKKVLSK